MSIDFGTYTVSSYVAPSQPLSVLTGPNWKYIRIQNNSPYELSINFVGISSITVPEFYMQDYAVTQQYRGTVIITPSSNITNISHSVSNIVTVQGFMANEVTTPLSQSIAQPAVTSTATGKPIFSATVGFPNTTTRYQQLNVYNPPNSGISYEFHAARCFTSDATLGNFSYLAYSYGPDYNMSGGSVAAVSHEGGSPSSVPISTAHCTYQDSSSITGNPYNTIEGFNTAQNLTIDHLSFPDVLTINPGTNCTLFFQMGGLGAAGYVCRLTLKWTEDVYVPPQGGLITTGIADTLINDGKQIPTQIIETTPLNAGSSAISIMNDGSFLWKVLQTGVYHQIMKGQTANSPLQLVQANDSVEVLGNMLINLIRPFQGTNLAIDTMQASDQILLRNNGSAILSILSNAIIASQVLQSPANTDLLLNVPTSSNGMRLRNAGSDVMSIISSAVQLAQILQPNTGATATFNGNTSGSVNMYCPIWGSAMKLAIGVGLSFNGTNSGDLIFPSALTAGFFISGSIQTNTWSFKTGGSTNSSRHWLTIGGAGAAGTDEGVTLIRTDNLGQGAGDRVGFNGSGVGFSGFAFFIFGQ